ncbi:MAG: endolytic transglycosylase MltG [Alphaproteobacteria bacterium]|nr:endolytic transglycosylase MltG [Alphaproteobacteria bacterium]
MAVLLLCATGAGVWGYRAFERPGPSAETVLVMIPPGAGVSGITRRLEQAGVIDQPFVFAIGARLLHGRSLRAGEYEIPAQASAHAIVDLLASGKTYVRRLTVPEGLTVAEALEIVAVAEGLTGLIERQPGEGELLPETYNYSYGDRRDAVMARMAAAMQRTLAELWERRAPNLPLTGVEAERARVAGVFINRLRQGMRLESDPTVVYALSRGGEPLGRPLTRKDLETDDPYNTYRNTGLPPGPIANPGRAALAAALSPMATDELYFVADGAGGHRFARTYAEHLKNVARYRALRDGQPASE